MPSLTVNAKLSEMGCFALPSQLSKNSKIEIEYSNVKKSPYKIQIITIEELSDAEARADNLFVDTIIVNKTIEPFVLALGDQQRPVMLMRVPEKSSSTPCKVHRNFTTRIWMQKEIPFAALAKGVEAL